MLAKQAGAPRRENAALQSLAQGIPLLSLGIRNARTAEIVRMAKTAGFGLVWIDLEHSSISIDCAAQIIASAADLGLEAWARVPEREYGAIGRLLDGGATGIIAPRIETVGRRRMSSTRHASLRAASGPRLRFCLRRSISACLPLSSYAAPIWQQRCIF